MEGGAIEWDATWPAVSCKLCGSCLLERNNPSAFLRLFARSWWTPCLAPMFTTTAWVNMAVTITLTLLMVALEL
jgi:hypothetical protein